MKKQLAQLLIEEQANTHNIKKHIKTTLKETPVNNIRYLQLLDYINVFLNAKHDECIQNEVNQLKESMTIDDIAQSMLVALAYATRWTPIQAICATIGNSLCYKEIFTGIEMAAELLCACERSNLYTISVMPNNIIQILRKFDLPEEVEIELSKALYPLPMICKPQKVKNRGNIDTSHLIERSSLILGKINHHEEYICVDTINMLNSIKLSLDVDIANEEEVPNKPLETIEQISQFEKLAEDSLAVYQEILDWGNEFYLTWKYDFRGRMYSQGYHINIQSTDYKKALISFTDKEVIDVGTIESRKSA